MREKKKALREAVRSGHFDPSFRAPATEVGTSGDRVTAGDPLALVERLPRFEAAHTVALYCALPDEVPTAGMLDRWGATKRLALPVVRDGEMSFREYTGSGNLQKGAFGILEPALSPSPATDVIPTETDRATRDLIPTSEIDLMLVPGVAFDRTGRRLGRGGGFYDRYLSRLDAARIYKIGLCPPRALVPEVPAEAHDIKMDIVVVG